MYWGRHRGLPLHVDETSGLPSFWPLLSDVRYHPNYCNYGPAVIFSVYGPADEPGAGKLCNALAALGTIPARLKPHGAKDWNEVLQQAGRVKMKEVLTRAVFPRIGCP